MEGVSLSRGRNTGSQWEDSLDALVVIVVCQQSPLLQVSLSGAPNRVTLAPLCIVIQGASGEIRSSPSDCGIASNLQAIL